MTHDELMRQAIRLAKLCKPKNDAIPRVGAVISLGEEMITFGHRGTGDPGDDEHAEKNAIDELDDKSRLAGATLYTTLEPCTREVRSNELECCTELIMQHQIKRVLIGILDPNQGVRGKGLSELQDKGIEVGLFPDSLAAEIRSINAPFWRIQQTLGACIISPENGDVLKTYETNGKHTVRFQCLNPPTEDTHLVIFSNGSWWPQPHNFRHIEKKVWAVDAHFGTTGTHSLHLVTTTNALGRALIRYYWKVTGINRDRKDKLSGKLSEADRPMLRYVSPGIEMTDLPKGLLSEDFVIVEIAAKPS
jgi:pyrimidine deaminase RibD-like protein